MRTKAGVCVSILLAALWVCGIAASRARAAGEPAAAQSPEGYDQIVADYLSGNWESLEKSIAPTNKSLNKLTSSQNLDIKYIRESLAECRPAWWKLCKANQEINFRPSIWGKTMIASFDPGAKNNLNINFANGQASMTFMWAPQDMDNPAEAEHGFSKGDLSDLNVWQLIGSAGALAVVPIEQQVNLPEAGKLKLQRYMDLDGNLTGVFYATPKARRWGLWVDLAGYLNGYAALPTVNSRKAIGSMFLAELVANRAKYPSIKLAEKLPDDGIEENLCIALKNSIEKNPWTLAEDRRIRDAIKAFALLNQKDLLQTNRVKMPNGLIMSLDPAGDGANQTARDSWLKKMLESREKQ
jgi:hypothetical protein